MDEGVCFPLRTIYSENSTISKCAAIVMNYPHIYDIIVAENGANKQLLHCLRPFNEEIDIGFSPFLFKELIAQPLLYIDKDLVCVFCSQFLSFK